MPENPSYRAGSAAVVAGSANVTGVGTLWVAEGLRPGDVFEAQGLTVSIDAIVSNTQLTLSRGWPGLGGSGAYEIRQTTDAVRVLAAARQLIADLASGNLLALSRVAAASNMLPYFTAPGAADVTPLTPVARGLLRETTVAGMRNALGLQGYTGAGIRILGVFPNMAGLPTTGNAIGDAYLVNGTVQIWTGNLPWVNAGPIVGPAGANAGPIMASRNDAAARLPSVANDIQYVFSLEDGGLVIRGRNAATDAIFASQPLWGIVQRQDVNTLSQGTIIPLSNVGGTANAITADTPTNYPNPSFVGGKLFRVTLLGPNTASNPTITVNGVTRQIRDADLSVLPIGALKAVTYIFETFGSQFARLVTNPVLVAELAAFDSGGQDYTDGKFTVLEDAPLLSDGSRTLMQFGGRDIMRMTPTGPRLAGQGGSVPAPVGGWAAAANALGQTEFTAQAGKRGIHAVDRFRETGGHRYPTALVDGVSRKAVIISVYGQSNADVTEMNDPLIWNNPPMPNHILMLNDVNGARGGLRGWMGVAAPAVSSLIPAREDAVYISATDSRVQSYSTAAAAKINAMSGAPYKVFGVRSHAVGGHPLVGSNTTTGIWKNSEGNYLAQWLNWTQDIRNMRNSLIALGYEIEAVHVFFTHQEADWQTSRSLYVSQFNGMKAERNAIFAADLPGVPVRWFVDQASGSGLRAGSYRGGAWQSRLAIVDIAETNADVTMVMPRHHMNFGFNGGTLEDIHHSARSRIMQGETYASAVAEILEGRQWKCPRMNSAAVSGNFVTVNFDSLLPIRIDPTFCKVRQDMGFKIGDGSVAVLGVTQTGQRQVRIECSASPAGQLLAYAWREQDGQDVSDEWPISTGAIRDAWEAPSLFLPGERILRPAVGYTLQL